MDSMSWVASAYVTPNGVISSNSGVLGSVYSDGIPYESAITGISPFITRYGPSSAGGHLPAVPVYASSLSAFDELKVGWSAKDTIVMTAHGEGTSILPVSAITSTGTYMYMEESVFKEWIESTGYRWHTLDAVGSGKRHVYTNSNGLNFYHNVPWFTAGGGTYTYYSGSHYTSVPATNSSRPDDYPNGVYDFQGFNDQIFITGITAVAYDKPM
jgi:hypothetical protein